MATFGALPSPAPNRLFDLAAAQGAAQGYRRNELLMQNAQQDQRAQMFERDATARIGMARELIGLPEDQAAAAWGSYRQRLQAAGLGQGLPDAFPGMERLRAVAGSDLTTFQRMQIEERRRSSEALMGALGLGAGASAPVASMGATPVSMPAPPPTAGAPAGGMEPRGVRNNNPLNLSFANQPGAVMETHATPRFARFETPEAGVSAAVNQLRLYQQRGNNTLAGMINTWAPPSENDTRGYVQQVAAATGLDPNQPVNLDDPAVVSRLVRAMAQVETGRPLDEGVVTRALGGRVSSEVTPVAEGAPAPRQAPAAPAGPALLPNGLTQQQAALVAATASSNPTQAASMVATFQAQNRSERQQAEANRRADEAAQRAEAAEARRVEADRRRGEREGIPQGYQRAADGVSLEPIPGGPAHPPTVAALATARGEGRGGKPIPGNERNSLIETATRVDEIGALTNTFQNDFAGYGSAFIGNAANTIARNTPGESARAEWWQRYQTQKNQIRNSLFGAALTPGEAAEYERSDINPGMSAETIRANLARQRQVIETAQRRRVRSMAADGYNTRSLAEATGVDVDTNDAAPAAREPRQPQAQGGQMSALDALNAARARLGAGASDDDLVAEAARLRGGR